MKQQSNISYTISQQTINNYAIVSGDHNPIHIDESFAQKSEFKGTIAHGMILVGYFFDYMSRSFGQEWDESGKLKSKFRNPARPNDTVIVSGSIQSIAQNPAENEGISIIKYRLELRNQLDELLSTGLAEFKSKNVSSEIRIKTTEENSG